MIHSINKLRAHYPQVSFSPALKRANTNDQLEEYVPVEDNPQETYEPYDGDQSQDDIYDDTDLNPSLSTRNGTAAVEPIQEDIYDDTETAISSAPLAPPPRLPPPNEHGYAQSSRMKRESMSPDVLETAYAGREIAWDYDVPDKKNKKMKMSDLKNIKIKGCLEKLGGKGHSTWQKRMCILSGSFLYFYEKENSKTFNNRVVIPGYEVSIDDDKSSVKKGHFVFSLKSDNNKHYYFRTPNAEERANWVRGIAEITQKASFLKPPPSPGTYAMLNEVTEEERSQIFTNANDDDIKPMDSDEELQGEKRSSETPRQQNISMPPPPEPERPLVKALPPQLPTKELVVDTDTKYKKGTNGLTFERIFVALFEFFPLHSDELQMNRGDLFHIVDSTSSLEWWYAEAISSDLGRSGRLGFIPANHLMQAFEVA